MTAKTVEDLFLADEVRRLGCVTSADAIEQAETHEEAMAIGRAFLALLERNR